VATELLTTMVATMIPAFVAAAVEMMMMTTTLVDVRVCWDFGLAMSMKIADAVPTVMSQTVTAMTRTATLPV
jgi:hypothetical protein